MNATNSDHNVQQAVPFFWVSDVQESVRFYVDGLGFTMTTKWVDAGVLRWCWLQLGAAAVMLQEVSKEARDDVAPPVSARSRVSVYFVCQDALAVYREVRSRGVLVKRPVVGNRMWVAEVTDPDGNALFFESPTDVAEETEYTE